MQTRFPRSLRTVGCPTGLPTGAAADRLGARP